MKRDRDYIYLACLLWFSFAIVVILVETIIDASFSVKVLAALVVYSYSFGYFLARLKGRAKNRIFGYLVAFGCLTVWGLSYLLD